MRGLRQLRPRWIGSMGIALLGACSALLDTDTGRLGGLPDGHDGGPDPQGCNEACDDGVACTVDSCESGRCMHRADSSLCDDGKACTDEICDETAGCRSEPNDERCQYCAPGSHCDAELGGCVGGDDGPRDCSDDNPCTTDRCDVASMSCVNEPRSSCGGLPETCEQAASVELGSNGRAVVEGSFGDLSADHESACGRIGGSDAVYRLEIDQLSDIVLDASGSDAEVVLAVGASCDGDVFGFGCAQPERSSDSGTTRLSIHRYDPTTQGGELFVLIDALESDEQDDFRVSIEVTPAAPDSCVDSVFDFSDCGTLIGFMQDWGTERGECQNAFGELTPEAIFQVRGRDGDLELTATSDTFEPALYARPECFSFEQLECDNAMGSGGLGTGARIQLDLDEGEPAIVYVDGGRGGLKYELYCAP